MNLILIWEVSAIDRWQLKRGMGICSRFAGWNDQATWLQKFVPSTFFLRLTGLSWFANWIFFVWKVLCHLKGSVVETQDFMNLSIFFVCILYVYTINVSIWFKERDGELHLLKPNRLFGCVKKTFAFSGQGLFYYLCHSPVLVLTPCAIYTCTGRWSSLSLNQIG